MVNWGAALSRKYAVMEQDAASRQTAANAQANLANTQARGMPSLTAAQTDLARARAAAIPIATAADAALAGARTRGLNVATESELADWADPMGARQAQVGLGFARIGTERQQADLLRGQVDDAERTSQMFDPTYSLQRSGGPLSVPSIRPLGLPRPPDERPRFGFAKGTARVPGRGDGTRDTVPAMLAPGEAVLNRPAADNLGRGLIAALNQMGARRMGMV